MRKKVIIISVVILLIVLLFPISEAEATGKVKPYNDGYIIKILNFEIYNNVR